MDIFFSSRYEYSVDEPIDDVRDRLKAISDRRWYDISRNIDGKIKEDDSFTFTHRWSLVVINSTGFGSDPAYLKGKLEKADNKTRISYSVRPNYGLVLVFYVFAGLFLAALFGITVIKGGPKIFDLSFFPLFSLILWGIMMGLTNGLRRRFERMMELKRVES